MISFMLEDQELFLSDKIVTIIISFVTEQSFCIARMVFEKRSKVLFSQKVRILLRKTRRNAMAVLEVKELTKKYGEGESEVIALDHVSFSVERGEFVAIIGASGSGKSTLMNMIGGIHPDEVRFMTLLRRYFGTSPDNTSVSEHSCKFSAGCLTFAGNRI